MPRSVPVQVLLIEDHPSDVTLARRSFSKITSPVELNVVPDGVEAMRYLRRQGRFHNAPRPRLILLDLTMPRMTGIEVLRAIGEEATLRVIPVIVLTSSTDPADVQEAYSHCANSYFVKPTGFDEFLRVIEVIETYWLNTAVLPV